MNISDIANVLNATLQANRDTRQAAEAKIYELTPLKGFLIVLDNITYEPSFSSSTKLAAAIALKNAVKRYWGPRINGLMPEFIVNDEDKRIIREKLLESIIAQNNNIVRKLLTEALVLVAEFDFPNNMPALLPSILNNLKSGDLTRMYRSLVPLRYLVKLYELKNAEDRKPLNDIVMSIFPLLLSLGENLLTSHRSLEAAEFLRVIVKTYWSSMQMTLPQCSSNPSAIFGWMRLLNGIMDLPLHEASANIEPLGQPTSIDDRENWPWWKCKKWSMRILVRFFNRHGNPKFVEPEFKELAQYFTKNLAVTILTTVLNTLSIRPKGGFCTDIVIHSCLTYVETSVEMAVTWKFLKPHLDFLVMKVMFPILAFNDRDQELWLEDPHEYCRKNFDVLSDFIDPRCAAMQLMASLGKLRPKQILPPFAAFCFQTLDMYQKSSPETRDYRSKDGVMTSFGALSSILVETAPYSSQIETFLWNHVYPELSSPVPFMRSRAAWTIQQFADYEYSDASKHTAIIEGVLNCMNDPELPVQLQSAVCLQHLVGADTSDDVVRPLLPRLLDQYLKLVHTESVTAVIEALGVLISKYETDIIPYAPALIERMVGALEQFLRENDGKDDNDEGAAMSAFTCLEVIETVLGAVGNHCEEKLPMLEPLMLPMMHTLLDPSYPAVMEYFEQILEFVTFFTFYFDPISDGTWGLLPKMIGCFHAYGLDFLPEMMSPLENFVHRGKNEFFSRGFLEPVFDVCRKVLVIDDQNRDVECICACRLLITIYQVGPPGSLDVAIVPTVTVIMKRLQHKFHLARLQPRLLQVLCMCLHYNPEVTISAFESLSFTSGFFGLLSSTLPVSKFIMDKKIISLGLTALLRVPIASLPSTIASNVPQLWGALTLTLSELQTMIDNKPEEEEEEDVGNSTGDVDEEEEEEEEEGFDDDEDAINAEDIAYMKGLKESNVEIDEYLKENDGDQDDDQFESPIDNINAVILFREILEMAVAREPEVYKQIQGLLPREVQTLTQQLFEKAEVLKSHSTLEN